MIYVIEEKAGGDSSKRNKHINASAVRDQGKMYGPIVTNKAEFVKQLESGDKTLCIYAHGNRQVVGRFSDMGELANYLKDQLGAFDVRKGKTLQTIVLNSCQSEDPARELATALQVQDLVAGRDLAVFGTQESAFTDETGAIRVARNAKAGDQLDKAVADDMKAHKFYQLIEANCWPAGQGLSTFQTA